MQFTAEEIRTITTTCAQMGGKPSGSVSRCVVSHVLTHFTHVATAHAYTDAAVRHAIDNGVTGIEHGNLISAETAKLYVCCLRIPYHYLFFTGWRRRAFS